MGLRGVPDTVSDIEYEFMEDLGVGPGWGVWAITVEFMDGTKRQGEIQGTRDGEGFQDYSEIVWED